MDNLKEKLNQLLNKKFYRQDEIQEYIDKQFTLDEKKSILFRGLLDTYLLNKININIKNKELNYIETEFGTFLTDREISNDLKEISLKELYLFINNTSFSYYKFDLLFTKYIEIIYYYRALKNKYDNYLKNLQNQKILYLIITL